jgi:hypothetical protein
LTGQSHAGYKAPLAALLLLLPLAGRAEKVAGAVLPDEVRKVAEYRYRVDRTYEETLKFFKAAYPPARYPRKNVASLPGVRAVHIENPEARPGGWEGLNVYEAKGETTVYVLVAPDASRNRKGR